MPKALLILLLTAIILPACLFGQTDKPDATGDVANTMRKIRAASSAADAESWKHLVAEDCVFVEPSGVIRDRSWHIPARGVANDSVKVTAELTDLKVRLHGETAVLTYIEKMRAQVGQNNVRSDVRFTEVYRRVNNEWQMIASSETPIPRREPISIDPKILDDYIGKYEVAPGILGTVYREGDRLMLIGTGWKQPYEMLPLSKDTFFLREFENTEITFLRDKHGSVTAQLSKTNGQETKAPKIPNKKPDGRD